MGFISHIMNIHYLGYFSQSCHIDKAIYMPHQSRQSVFIHIQTPSARKHENTFYSRKCLRRLQLQQPVTRLLAPAWFRHDRHDIPVMISVNIVAGLNHRLYPVSFSCERRRDIGAGISGQEGTSVRRQAR